MMRGFISMLFFLGVVCAMLGALFAVLVLLLV